MYNNNISILFTKLYNKRIETSLHARRMEKYCRIIGKKMELSPEEMNKLSLLALFHDIGKASISSDIILKTSELTPEEWNEIKRHPEIGCQIAKEVPELENIADYILAHHERWDGKGYPRGLKEKEIPFACRVVAVIDAYDAMTSDRPYRNAMSKEEAIVELERNAGSQFDSAIVDIFIETIKN
jgi:HD-GYP domain-containing protein (c-di-GMP phosphodiesterase class II)